MPYMEEIISNDLVRLFGTTPGIDPNGDRINIWKKSVDYYAEMVARAELAHSMTDDVSTSQLPAGPPSIRDDFIESGGQFHPVTPDGVRLLQFRIAESWRQWKPEPCDRTPQPK
ncbi:MAG: hypothetical protein JWO78_861 [Micavibrio sp.]|nr:hypothetical protein [Micavibrio sp.]